MRKLWKGVLLGAAVGGAVKAAQEVRGDGSIDEVGPAVAKAAGQAAVAGAALGYVLDRSDRRKLSRMQRAKAKAGIGGVVAGASALADFALPAIHAAAETARDKGVRAAEVAKPHVIAAADAARPRVEHAADLAKVRAQKAGEAARAKVAELDLPVFVAI